MKKLILILFCVISIINLQAQTVLTIGSGSNYTTPNESSPINIWFKSHHCQILYTPADLNNAGWTGLGEIKKLGFNIFGTTSEGLPNFSIKLKNTASNDLNTYDGSGLNLVYTSPLYSPISSGFELLTLDNSFIWDGSSNLLVDVCFDQVSNYSSTGQVYTYSYTTSGGSQYQFNRADGTPQCGLATNTSNLASKPQLQLELITLPICTGTPNIGNVVSSNTLVCPNTGFNLNLGNGSVASGLEFQWQSSPDGSSWTNLGTVQNSWSYSVNSITATTYYQCITTCTASAQSVTSTPIAVNLNPLINCYCLPTDQFGNWNCVGENFTDFSISNIINQPSYCGSGGYTDSTSSQYAIINLTAGNTYTLNTNTASINNYGNATMGAWIDFDQNGVFDTYEFTYLGLGTAGNYSKAVFVPITAPSGFVRMRLKLDGYYTSSNTIINACNNNNNSYSGQILDYKVNITAAAICAGTPSAGISVSSSTAVCKNESYTLDLANNSVSSGIIYQWQSSIDGGTTWANSGLAQNTIPLTIISQSVTTYYRCITTCTTSAPLSDTSTAVVVSQNLPTACYCNPDVSYCSSVAIYSVSIANLNYSPTCNYSNGYTNYADSVPAINLNAGSTYNLLTAVTTFSASLDGHVSAWIDYNQNGIFENPSEFISVGSYTTGTISQSISVPFTTIGGNTRMRIKLESNGFNYPGADPCTGNGSNGQTLDYLVSITSSTPCAGIPNAGDAISPLSNVCVNTPFTLDLINNDLVSGINYQWQSSPDNASWTNLGASQTSVPYTITNQSSSTYYRCVLTCGTFTASAFSNETLVTQNPLITCYCTPPPSVCSNNDEINNVIFATLSNTSTCSNDGYRDYSDTIASAIVTAGQTYSTSITVGSEYYGHVSSWIDYNQNGVFDSTEYKFLGVTNYPGDFTANDSIISIPTNALYGNTKMRIRNNNQFSFDSTQACADGAMLGKPSQMIGNGETEDYLVTILPSSEAVVGMTDICPSSSTTLNLSQAIPTATNITYQWKSFNGTTYVNDGLASTSSTFTAMPGASTPYYCEILCNGNVVLRSDTVFVKIHTITTAPITTSVTCNGMANGSITLNASDFGGTLNYTWTPTISGNDAVTNLGAGTYTVFISNSINCTFTQTISIIEPLAIIATSTKTDVSCYGLNDGAASMTVSGGISPLNFSWSSGGAALTTNSLAAGNYTFNIVDGNGCSQNEIITITQPGAMSVSISGKNSICEQLEDTISSSITGGISPFLYSWTELPGNVVSSDPNYTYTSTIGTYSYNLNVTDATNCIANSNTISITVNPSSNFSGVVTTNTTIPVAGRVVLYKYLPFYTKFDSVAGQNIGAIGDFLFNSFTAGTYIIKAIPTSTVLQIAYGDSAINWKTAKHIIHGCAVNDIQNIEVKALTSIGTGTGSLSGKITEGSKYKPRMANGYKPMSPGAPIGGIVVKGGRNPGGQMFVQTTTDTSGHYSLTGLPPNTGNESYFILVDIPGLDTNNTYHEIITLTQNQYVNLDFVVDSAKINPIHISDVSVHDISAIENKIKVFPNPANNKVTIQYNLLTTSNVKIELFDILGNSVKTILPLTQQSNSEHSYTVQLNDLTSGMYFMKVKINNSESVIKLIISN